MNPVNFCCKMYSSSSQSNNTKRQMAWIFYNINWEVLENAAISTLDYKSSGKKGVSEDVHTICQVGYANLSLGEIQKRHPTSTIWTSLDLPVDCDNKTEKRHVNESDFNLNLMEIIECGLRILIKI